MIDAAQLEEWAAEIHGVYMETARRLGWPIRPEVNLPYAELPESAKELDRAFAQWAGAKQAGSLEWIFLDDLVAELRRRFNTVIFAGIQDLDQNVAQEYFRFKGDFRRCQGLAAAMVSMIQERVDEARQSERVDEGG